MLMAWKKNICHPNLTFEKNYTGSYFKIVNLHLCRVNDYNDNRCTEIETRKFLFLCIVTKTKDIKVQVYIFQCSCMYSGAG